MLLSKRPEMILPEKWPNYFSKAKKVYISDLDNNKYLDMMCIVGHNILGYANEKVDCIDKEHQSVLTADGKIVWVCGKRISNWVKITQNTNQIAVLSRNMVQ